MELHALTGQLYMLDGVEQEGSAVPGLLALPAPAKAAHGRQNELLLVHLTVSGPASETSDLLQNEVEHIGRRYFESVGSVTAALRRVIQETNTRLLQYNLNAQGIAREGAITCAVQRGSELFLIQAGESLALIGRNYGVERMPAHRPDHVTPLGQSAGLDFRYFHQRLQPGDMLLLADPRISHLPSRSLAPALVDTELELGLDELREALSGATGRLLLVEFTDEPYGAQSLVSRPSLTRGRISLALGLGTRAAREKVVVPAQPVREVKRAPVAANDDISALELAEAGLSIEDTARQAAASSAEGLARATGWTADAMGRLRPPAPEEEEEKTHWVLPTLLAIIIPVLVALVVSGVYLQRGRVQQVTQLRQLMSQNLVLAQEATGAPDQARVYYEQILALAAQAEELRPGDAGVAEIRRQASLALDELDGVARLTAQQFYTFGSSTDLRAVAIRDDFTGGVFVLDDANNVVYSLDTDEAYDAVLSEEPETISFGGQAIGTHVVSDLIDIMWRPSGAQVDRDGLAILDGAGELVSYYPTSGEVRSATLGLSSEWQAPAALTQFAERIYVLDPPAEVIWKYFPQDEGFSVDEGERTLFLTSEVDLRNANDIDLYSEDGSLLVTYPDGRVQYVDTGAGRILWNEEDLLRNGLAAPLQRLVAGKIVGRGLNASIFLLDAGSGRVIQVSRLGNVLAQYRATDGRGQNIFAGATDLAIAETPLRIFVSNGNRLYQATQ